VGILLLAFTLGACAPHSKASLERVAASWAPEEGATGEGDAATPIASGKLSTAWDSVGRRLYVAGEQTEWLVSVDPETGRSERVTSLRPATGPVDPVPAVAGREHASRGRRLEEAPDDGDRLVTTMAHPRRCGGPGDRLALVGGRLLTFERGLGKRMAAVAVGKGAMSLSADAVRGRVFVGKDHEILIADVARARVSRRIWMGLWPK
jgi:hypothetical protein